MNIRLSCTLALCLPFSMYAHGQELIVKGPSARAASTTSGCAPRPRTHEVEPDDTESIISDYLPERGL